MCLRNQLRETIGRPKRKVLESLCAPRMCSEEATLIGIIFSCERWGLECARGDIQLAYCVPEVASNGGKEQIARAARSQARPRTNVLEMMSTTCNWTVAGAPWQRY